MAAPDPIVLNEEESARLLENAEENMSCIMCPYFTPYSINIGFGMIGHCQALETLASRKTGLLGGVRAWLMRLLARGMWSMIVEKCPYYKRAKAVEA
jgi:hypothetical protein